MSAAQSPDRFWKSPRFQTVACALVILLVAFLTAGQRLNDPGALKVGSDTPHYLMNGVFASDLMLDHPTSNPVRYARMYYARYPALTLGHHPMVTSMVVMPFFAVLGVGLGAARLSILITLMVMLLVWFRFMQRAYDTPTALFSTLLVTTMPGLIPLFQEVLSEPPALCLIVIALFFLDRFCRSGQRRDWIVFVVAAIASLYAKQLAIFAFPVYLFRFVATFGFRGLLSRRAVVTMAVIGVCLVPVAVITFTLSRFNVQIVTEFVSAADRLGKHHLVAMYDYLTTELTPRPVLLIGLVSAIVAVWRRDQRAMLFLFWYGVMYLELAALSVPNPRFAVYGALPLSVLIASAIQIGRTPRARLAWMAVLTVAVGYQSLMLADTQLKGYGAYDASARFVSERPAGDSILYSADEDGGYFVFFVRAHDPQRRNIVIRADKVFTTSRMGESNFENLIKGAEDILPILNRFGVGYVVLEERNYPEGPLRWLQHLVKTDAFALRQRTPVTRIQPGTETSAVLVYEYLNRRPADPGAVLSMNIPLMGDTIAVTMRDLLNSNVRQTAASGKVPHFGGARSPQSMTLPPAFPPTRP